MTSTEAPMTVLPTLRRGRDRWSGLHVFLHWPAPQMDTFLTGTVAPLLDGLRVSGQISDWFFIRYAEGGPHLRVRMRDAATHTLRLVQRSFTAQAGSPLLPIKPGWAPHGQARRVAYEPEIERYGGREALPFAERVFAESTQLALDVLRLRPSGEQKLAVATDLILVTAAALDLDRLGIASWLRRAGLIWRTHQESAGGLPSGRPVPKPGQAEALNRRWDSVTATAGQGELFRDRWWQIIRKAHSALDDHAGRSRLDIWYSQLHMLLNRLGVSPHEEIMLGRAIASVLLAPQGNPDFFADHPGAVDRAYLAGAAFHPGLIAQQEPRTAAGRPRAALSARKPVVMPPGEPVTARLTDALAARHSARGDFSGDLSAAGLGNLLRTAYGTQTTPGIPTPDVSADIDVEASARAGAGAGAEAEAGADARAGADADADARAGAGAGVRTGAVVGRAGLGMVGRPYPSAGAKYPVRLRLIAREVSGVPSGLYEVGRDGISLLPLAPAPRDCDLVAASMWLAAEPSRAGDFERVPVPGLPALLALHLDLGAARAAYGLRALRFGLLEAGHLAQNLALTAAALGLSLGMLGGFYDELANELFLLDGVDEHVIYLLPLGRRPGLGAARDQGR